MGILLILLIIFIATRSCNAISISDRASLGSKALDDWTSVEGRDGGSKNKVRPDPQFRYFTPSKPEMDIIKNSIFSAFRKKINSTFDTTAQTVFIIHGYLGGNKPWPVDIKDALIEKEKCNVFIVDWSGLDGIWYGTARENVKRVGRAVGRFIKKLKVFLSLDLEKFHVVGHSLGAHVSGFAGKWLQKKGYKLGRITGLDPAGPEFNDLDDSERLSLSDADFVDVIHTNWAGAFKPLDVVSAASGFGLEASVGHFDFYPNGGEDQPGCKTAFEAELDIGMDVQEYLSVDTLAFKFMSGGLKKTKQNFNDLACSHSRAHEYFYWSIKDKDNGCRFSADECPSWSDYDAGKCMTPADQLPKVQMGYYSVNYKERIEDKPQRRFYLRTTDAPPYCVK